MNRREKEIRKLVCQQIAYYLDEDRNGGETLMKEIWEECENDSERAIARNELSHLSVYLRALWR